MALRPALTALAVAAALAALVLPQANLPAPGTAAAQVATTPSSDDDLWQGLPPGTGREETFIACVPCHSLRLVTQQRLSKWRWNETIDRMIDEEEMSSLSVADRELIVSYLATFFGEEREAD